MENASKALIIAGAILIAILLISVGIMVMNAVNKPVDEAANEATSQAAQMFNSKFTSYAGKNRSAQDVKTLLTAVQASNSSDSNHKIAIRPKDIMVGYHKPEEVISKVESGTNYDIYLHYSLADYKISGGDDFPATQTRESSNHNEGALNSLWGGSIFPSEEGYICIISIDKQ